MANPACIVLCAASVSVGRMAIVALAILGTASDSWAGEPEFRPGITIPFVAVNTGVGAIVGCSVGDARGCYLGSMLGATLAIPMSMTYAHLFGDMRSQVWLMTLAGSVVGAAPLLFLLEDRLAVLSMLAPLTTAIAAAVGPMLITDPAPRTRVLDSGNSLDPVSPDPLSPGVGVAPIPGGLFVQLRLPL